MKKLFLLALLLSGCASDGTFDGKQTVKLVNSLSSAYLASQKPTPAPDK